MVLVVGQMGGLPSVSATIAGKEINYTEMTPEEQKAFLKKVSKICPDPEAFKECFNFKITSLSISSAPYSARQSACHLSNLSALGCNFSKEEQAGLLEKAKTAEQRPVSPGFLRQGIL